MMVMVVVVAVAVAVVVYWYVYSCEGLLLYRRNFMDKFKDSERGIKNKIEGGGYRLSVCREVLTC
jgi:hypothetical protein